MLNLHTVFENISLNVAKTFENQVDDKSQWHSALLKNMTLEIEGIRLNDLINSEEYALKQENCNHAGQDSGYGNLF
ncbi:ribonuclease toxin HepT-like protein [Leptodesmis sp.]|uniref:ribonuclease toxin HepT-like protein n=1 Tax=Leptodesmis sp. TaxID=3100501 RepID=UPI0040535434